MSTWREVASELAERLAHQAGMCGASGVDGISEMGCPHDRYHPELTEAECPFCADRAVWLRWSRKEAMEAGRRARRTARRGHP